ncbi:hypothetical protein AAE478_007210 [Parahypoxylon ruwenzoriense]
MNANKSNQKSFLASLNRIHPYCNDGLISLHPPESSLALALRRIISDAVVVGDVDPTTHVDFFIRVARLLDPFERPNIIVYRVLFAHVITRILPDNIEDFLIIQRLLKGVIQLGSVATPRAPLFTRDDLKTGLSWVYRSAHVYPSARCLPPYLNFTFHSFAATLYRDGMLEDPVFFVTAMRDALECSWCNSYYLYQLVQGVGYWIMMCGELLVAEARRGYELRLLQDELFVQHGVLYEIELSKTYGGDLPAPDLTAHRWRF